MAKPMYFDRGKFKELVIYLCAAAEQAGDDGFGMPELGHHVARVLPSATSTDGLTSLTWIGYRLERRCSCTASLTRGVSSSTDEQWRLLRERHSAIRVRARRAHRRQMAGGARAIEELTLR